MGQRPLGAKIHIVTYINRKGVFRKKTDGVVKEMLQKGLNEYFPINFALIFSRQDPR